MYICDSQIKASTSSPPRQPPGQPPYLETRRQKLKAEMVYKSLNGLTPNYLSSKFIQSSDYLTYNLRDSDNKLAIPLSCANCYKNSLICL